MSIHTQKTKHMCIALRLADINIDEDGTVLVLRILDMVERKGGNGTLRDVAKIKTDWVRDVQIWADARRNELAQKKAKPKMKP